jgi:two-component system, OmpR family, alkaline phosphatase synthesis response regulator PhoP
MSRPKCILIADDDPVSLRVLGFTLKRQGYAVVLANDGEEAWERMMRESVDLVITDRAMPRVDGLGLLRTIRGSEGHRTVPVIMLTASPLDSAEPEATAEGAAAFLTKPVSSNELVATIERVLGSPRA